MSFSTFAHRLPPALLSALASLLVLSGCRQQPGPAGTVVVYTSVDEVFARPVAEEFERQTGVEVRLVPDTEETKSTGLLNRLIAEKNRPQADVFWSGDPVRAAILKSKGVSAPYSSPTAEDLPKRFSESEGYWTGFSARARIIIYNTNLLSGNQIPTSVLDLAEPRYQGKGAIANPLFGTTSMHAAALFEVLGEQRAEAFFHAMTTNKVRMLSSNGEVRRRVAAGDLAFGLTDTDDFNVARQEGKPVDLVYPDAEGMGTLIIPNVAVLIANAPHPQTGKAFIDYLLSPQVERALAESEAAQMPARSGVEVPPHVRPLAEIKPMEVDYGDLARRLEALADGFLKEWVDANAR